MTETILDASIIICAYTEKRWDDLVAAVESVQQQNAREIVVVVDHNPALLARVQAYFPDVIGIENSEPQGLSGARNSGVAIAQGTLIAFLDDDAMAEPDWLARLCSCCADPQVMGTGGTVEPYWLSKQPKWFPEEFYWTLGCTYQERPEKPVVVRNPFGGCTCYRRELFEAVGGFRSGIGRDSSARPMGGEETELCIRARQYWPEKIFLYEPEAIIHHRIPAVRATWRYFRVRCYAEGLSKAVVAQYVGAKDGLSSERSYIVSNLVCGVTHGLRDTFVQHDIAGIARAGAIVVGLTTTMMGYLVGSIKQRFKHTGTEMGIQKIIKPALPIR
jgi:glucosyl-dolichyl phosphate glucuronosyltransferase